MTFNTSNFYNPTSSMDDIPFDEMDYKFVVTAPGQLKFVRGYFSSKRHAERKQIRDLNRQLNWENNDY